MTDFFVSLICSRYTLGTSAVAIFAGPWIADAFNRLATIGETLANLPGIGQ